MNGKKSFVLYCDLIHTIEKLPDDKAGQLIKIIFEYVNDKNPLVEDLLLQIAFEPIKRQLKRDLEHWSNVREARSENGKLGGRPRKQNKAKKANGFLEKQTEAKKAVNVTVNVNDNVNDTVNDNDTIKESIDKKMENFKLEIMDYKNEYSLEILNAFWEYWSEPNTTKTKMRKDIQKTWDTKRRLNTWKRNQTNFKTSKTTNGKETNNIATPTEKPEYYETYKELLKNNG